VENFLFLISFNPLSPVPRAVVYNFLAISGNGGLSRTSYTSEVWTAGHPAVRTQRVNLLNVLPNFRSKRLNDRPSLEELQKMGQLTKSQFFVCDYVCDIIRILSEFYSLTLPKHLMSLITMYC